MQTTSTSIPRKPKMSFFQETIKSAMQQTSDVQRQVKEIKEVFREFENDVKTASKNKLKIFYVKGGSSPSTIKQIYCSKKIGTFKSKNFWLGSIVTPL